MRMVSSLLLHGWMALRFPRSELLRIRHGPPPANGKPPRKSEKKCGIPKRDMTSPTTEIADSWDGAAAFRVGLVGTTTNLAAGLLLAEKFPELAAVVIVTDGLSNDNAAALDADRKSVV